jgi:hypothetical protein
MTQAPERSSGEDDGIKYDVEAMSWIRWLRVKVQWKAVGRNFEVL